MRTIAGLKSKEEKVKNALDEQRHKADEARNQQKEYMTEKNTLKKGTKYTLQESGRQNSAFRTQLHVLLTNILTSRLRFFRDDGS